MKSIFSILFLFCVSVSGADLNFLSAKVDAVLEKQYLNTKIKPLPFVSEEVFLRRAYLTIIGRNPTFQEYNAYSSAAAQNKKTELIKYLLKHPGHVSHMFNFWADALRLRERLSPINNFNGGPYIDYIKDCIAANKPYNLFVKDLLLSKGSYYSNPATGYYYRDVGMPLDNLIATSKVFLGTDIGCAQCHDDPFQDFTQMQFYKMAAMFNQVELRPKESKETREKIRALRETIEALIKSDPVKNRGLNNQINNFVRATQADLEIVPEKELKLPHDYQYKDAKPNDSVVPSTLDGKGAIKNKDDLREDAVSWLANPKHPTFTKNIVNRYWNLIFGKYLISEFDNIHSAPSLNSELLNVLADIFVELNYDSQKFLFALCNTKLFQRETYSGAYSNSENFIFIGPVKRRLAAEQLWDSVVSLCVEQPESFKTEFHTEYSKNMQTALEDFSLERMKQKIEKYNQIMREKYSSAPKISNIFVARASEINDSNQSNSILSQLGRSDRELIQTSSLEGSVTQVISFMNGQLASLATNKETSLMKTLAGKTPAEKVEIIYKSILARKPTLSEKTTFQSSNDDDVIWALLNSTEFKFSN
jgi:hypothetical protein